MRALAELQGKAPQTKVEIMRGLAMRLTLGRIVVGRLHYSAHPDRDPETCPQWKDRERRAYSSQAAWDREQEIIDEAGGGELVFADMLQKYWSKIVIEDPAWRPDFEFRVEGGFDYGKTNPTALLRAYMDFDGAIVYAGEYYRPGWEIWQHAKEIKRMQDFERMETIYADPSMFYSTSQQSQTPGHAPEIARSYSELYSEQTITNLCSFRGDRSDVSFAARLMQHWADLDNREPTVKIFCPRGQYSDKPQPGLYHWSCPNLLWELMNTRRVKLTSQQLLHRNVSEALVDKDNHARDAMKYHLMSHPEPAKKSYERRVSESFAALGTVDPTVAYLRLSKILEQERQLEKPIYYSGNARHVLRELEMQQRQNW